MPEVEKEEVAVDPNQAWLAESNVVEAPPNSCINEVVADIPAPG